MVGELWGVFFRVMGFFLIIDMIIGSLVFFNVFCFWMEFGFVEFE